MVVEASAVSAAIGVLRLARDALKGLKRMDLASEHKEAVQTALDQLGDVQDRISDIQSESIELREENAKLRSQISESDVWNERAANYKVITTDGGGRVLVSLSKGELATYYCPACFELRSIYPLQNDNNTARTYSCPSCGAPYPIEASRMRQNPK